MFVVNYRKSFFALSGLLIAISIAAVIMFGFNVGIDFVGGSITQASYATARPDQMVVASQLDKLEIGNFVLQPIGTKNYSLRTKELTVAQKDAVFQALTVDAKDPAVIEQYNSVGPVVGTELKNKAVTAIVVVMICIVLFITYAFRKVSEPVASWKYGFATIVALLHDVIIPTGLFIIYAHYTGAEIDVLFVSALLAVLGYSVHDTIVVFDRVREHLSRNRSAKNRESFETTVGKSVSETFGRSINTSLTIFFVLLVLFLIGGEATKDFALVLLFGVVIGTYSSIFVASPLLVTLEKLQAK